MHSHYDSEFIDFKSKDWENVSELLSNSDALTGQTIYHLINYLQTILWRTTFNTIIHPSKINIEEFVDYFKWASQIILELPKTFPNGLSGYMKQNIIHLNKFQCLSIVASMFFSCTHKVHTFLDEREEAKYKFLMTYFKIMRGKSREELESETFIIEKKVLNEGFSFDYWKNSQVKLKKLQVDEETKIEDFDDNFLKVDFANMYIGGGVLNFGCVQEEILFVIYPEMIVSMFFCRPMEENEAIVLKGARRVANYTGYAWGLRFKEEYTATQNPSLNTFVAIDALMFPSFQSQFSDNLMVREINKAYIGFSPNSFDDPSNLQPVVTGKWGCGEFGGFAPLKALLMWIAASAAGRDMIMTTFKDRTLQTLSHVGTLYEGSTVGELIDLLHKNHNFDILEFLVKHKQNPGSVKKVEEKEFKLNLPPGIQKESFNYKEKHVKSETQIKSDVKHDVPTTVNEETQTDVLEIKKNEVVDEERSHKVDDLERNSNDRVEEVPIKDLKISKDESIANAEESKDTEATEGLKENLKSESNEGTREESKEAEKEGKNTEISSGTEFMQGNQIIEETNEMFMDIDKSSNNESKTEKSNLTLENPKEKTSDSMDLDTPNP